VTQDARTSAQEPVLELKGLCKSFGGLQAVRGVDLKISAGDR
jgi:ABC-type branched-subunit amino acid transport system ATPase component